MPRPNGISSSKVSFRRRDRHTLSQANSSPQITSNAPSGFESTALTIRNGASSIALCMPRCCRMAPSGIMAHRPRFRTSRWEPTCMDSIYLKNPQDPPKKHPDAFNKGQPIEAGFQRCFRIEDDFTHHTRQKQLWKIDSVDLSAMKLTASLQSGAGSVEVVEKGSVGVSQNSATPSLPSPKTFDLQNHTRVWKGRSLADLKALQAGQSVLFNLTWVTLYGPGRLTDIWLDEESRALSTEHQMTAHRSYIRQRGLPGWVTAVEDEPQFVTITFFGNVDPKLFDELTLKDPDAKPPADGSPPPTEPRGRLAVARSTLMTYDPVNDTKTGSVLEVKKIPAEPGSSGVQLKLKMDMMLEGYRPKSVVRFYAPTWKVIALPMEEQFHGRE